MKIAAFFALVILITVSCKKDNPAPEDTAPVMTGISISGSELVYEVEVTINSSNNPLNIKLILR